MESPADGKGRMGQKEYREKNNNKNFKSHGEPILWFVVGRLLSVAI
jgi:hypothetical protein